jgi:23S rRNA (pseudouridine1915-N3)-methyltransferase
MNIRILTLHKITDRFTKEAVAEYSKRLSKYCKLSHREYKSEVQLLKEIDNRSFLIYISPEGMSVSSEDLAAKFSELALSGKSDVSFIVSSSKLPEDILKRVNFTLAISRMNIDFEVLLVILYEQIYRAYRINSNEPYHK